MRKSKRIVSLVLTVFLLLAVFSGCGSKKASEPAKEKTNASDTAQKPKEKIALTVCLPEKSWAVGSSDPELIEASKKFMEEQTTTTINIVSPPDASYIDKLAVLISSGDVPDVFVIQQAMVKLPTFAIRGDVQPLDEYINKSPVLSKIEKKYLDFNRVEGKSYGLPRNMPSNKILYFRNDILESCGVKLSETPTTDEFYNQMKKIADKGIIPVGWPKWIDNLRFFYNAFGAYNGILPDKNGKYYDGFDTPEMKEAMAYITKLYKDGILDKEFVTNSIQAMKDKTNAGKAASISEYTYRYMFAMNDIKAKNPSLKSIDLQPVYKLVGPKGTGGSLNEAIQDVYAVGKKTKNVQRAVDFIEWFNFNEEGLKLRYMGVKDKHFTIANDVVTPTNKAKASGYVFSFANFLNVFTKIDNYGFSLDQETKNLMPKQEKITTDSAKHLGPNIVVPAGKSDMYDKAQPSIIKKQEELAVGMLMGTKSIEDGFKEYAAFWKSINGEKILEEINKK